MADIELPVELREEWGVPIESLPPVPQQHRNAKAYKKAKSRWMNRILGAFRFGIWTCWDTLISRALWNDIEEFIWTEESGLDRPAVRGTRNNFTGFIFRKDVSFDEVLYFKARNKYANGKVRLLVSSAANTIGGVMFSVGVATDLDGPYTIYSPQEPLAFDPEAPQPQIMDIDLGELAPGKIYYYKLVREHDHQGDTLDGDVVLTGVMVR